MGPDYAIIGGGAVGLAVAWGLLKRGKTVTVIDGGDGAYRATRGNFGLIWLQGKGIGKADYARWSQKSIFAWPSFSADLSAASDYDVALEQNGGYKFFFTDDSLVKSASQYEALKSELDGNYPFEVLGHNELRREEPEIGPKVVGAILHHQDGHANPLKLLKSLAQGVLRTGGRLLTGKAVQSVRKVDGFEIICSDGTRINAEKVVLAAGLGAAELGPQLGFMAPIRPQRGQLLVTEKLPKFIKRPSLITRQVEEGGVQIGATNEEVGYDDQVTTGGLSRLASQAIAAYPILGKAQLVRSWGALRVMSPDGLPIYQESKSMPGAYMVTCHSGITLAAAHAEFLPEWLESTGLAPDLSMFSEERFENVSIEKLIKASAH
ncbi:FAD-binding oxidoreductase [Agrobacterium tumefaciens]|uniref:NAD(P)/FAD-dependent oxidoreductase n=1 Tax=Agrobacterium tumefaciens TaxID=358 RepID=UPI001574657C|nr:FAD-dependent oxidoreductase [Agrobacterium tumefaciens]NTA50029.1 FAD-binding oxidoreductase [Agrobacterium tumefaciens]